MTIEFPAGSPASWTREEAADDVLVGAWLAYVDALSGHLRDVMGVTEHYDYRANQWVTTPVAVARWRARQRRQAILGSREDTLALNQHEMDGGA